MINSIITGFVIGFIATTLLLVINKLKSGSAIKLPFTNLVLVPFLNTPTRPFKTRLESKDLIYPTMDTLPLVKGSWGNIDGNFKDEDAMTVIVNYNFKQKQYEVSLGATLPILAEFVPTLLHVVGMEMEKPTTTVKTS